MRTIPLLLAIALAGCATSDVYRVAGDQYRVTSSAITSFGGAGSARSKGVKRANQYCASQGKVAVVTDSATNANIAQGTSDVTFRCEAQ